MLQSDPYPGSQVPVAEMPSDANPFDGLKGNYVVRTINAELVLIIIATEGNDFFDRNHTEKAADHIANIIASHELGGFPTDTLPSALCGRKVKMTNFTTKVLVSSILCTFCLKLMIDCLTTVLSLQAALTRCITRICVSR